MRSLSLTITLTKRDYVALYRQLIDKKIFWLSAAPLILAIPLSAFILIYTGINNGAPLALLLAPFALVVGLALWVFYRAGRAPAIQQYRDARQSFGARFQYEFTDDTLICHAGEQQHTVEYRKLFKALETRRYIFLFVSQGKAYVFPKAALSQPELSLLREKMALAGAAKEIEAQYT